MVLYRRYINYVSVCPPPPPPPPPHTHTHFLAPSYAIASLYRNFKYVNILSLLHLVYLQELFTFLFVCHGHATWRDFVTPTWLPALAIFVLVADWISYAVFFRYFCNIEYKEEVREPVPPYPWPPPYRHLRFHHRFQS